MRDHGENVWGDRLDSAVEAAHEAVLAADGGGDAEEAEAAVLLGPGGRLVVQHLDRDRLVGRLRQRRLDDASEEAAQCVDEGSLAVVGAGREQAGAPRGGHAALKRCKPRRRARPREHHPAGKPAVETTHAVVPHRLRGAVQRPAEGSARAGRLHELRGLLLKLQLALHLRGDNATRSEEDALTRRAQGDGASFASRGVRARTYSIG